MGLQSPKAQASWLRGGGVPRSRSVRGGCSHWGWGGRDNGAQHLLLAGRRDPPLKSRGKQGSVGGIDEKGWSQGDAAGRKEEKGKEGRWEAKAFLPFPDLVWSASLLGHCFLRKLRGPPRRPPVSPQPLAAAPVPVPGIQQVLNTYLGERRHAANFLLWELLPPPPHILCPLRPRSRGQSRSWEHARAPHE